MASSHLLWSCIWHVMFFLMVERLTEMSKFWLVPLLLILMVIVPFLVWGERLESFLNIENARQEFGGGTSHVGLTGIMLLLADLFLPIPTTSVIAGLGIVYGPVIGTLYALAGSLLAACAGYALGRFLGRPFAVRWLGSHLETGERAFARHGGWIVAASRWMPVLPEVISVCAGVSRMAFPAFLVAVLCGALPHCAAFAIIGHLGADTPAWTVLISALIPIGLWFLAVRTGLAQRLGLEGHR
ncbi:MAG: VTT domain-containing protein [Pseudomonadota bacterium]